MMNQKIRNNTFETNSSSTHSLAIIKKDLNAENLGMEENIPIMENFNGYTNDPQELISYIYTIALISHDWGIIDLLKEEFPYCIFQKPQWDLPYHSETGYCDDRDVITFCDLLNSDMCCYFDKEQRTTIYTHLKDFIFKGELFICRDGSYENDCVPKYHIEKFYDEHVVKAWIDNNVIILLSEGN